MSSIFKKISQFCLENIVSSIISIVMTALLSYFFVYYIILTSSFWFFFFIIIVLSILIYVLIQLIVQHFHLQSNYFNKYIIWLFSWVISWILLSLFTNYFLITDKIDYYNSEVSFIQNLPNKNITAIEKRNNLFILSKTPQTYHPYMGVISFGKFSTDKRFLIEMEWTLRGESELWIVFLKDGKMPTEYIELLASTTKDTIALNDVDGKWKHNITKETPRIYEDRKFKLYVDYQKSENKACIYYNSIYTPLFNERCVNTPSNLDIKFVWFKIVDSDVSNNNLKVPEISKFIAYSLRF